MINPNTSSTATAGEIYQLLADAFAAGLPVPTSIQSAPYAVARELTIQADTDEAAEQWLMWLAPDGGWRDEPAGAVCSVGVPRRRVRIIRGWTVNVRWFAQETLEQKRQRYAAEIAAIDAKIAANGGAA